jgi:hypothetical protein
MYERETNDNSTREIGPICETPLLVEENINIKENSQMIPFNVFREISDTIL